MEDYNIVLVGLLILLTIVVCCVVCFTRIPYASSTDVKTRVIPDDLVLQQREEVLNLVNELRQRGAVCGSTRKGPTTTLRLNYLLEDAAQLHSEDMAANDYFSHESADGTTFVERVQEAGYDNYEFLGENIAVGYSDAQSVVDAWMSSEGHCNNIMNPDFEELGVGIAENEVDNRYYWVQEFGRQIL